MSLDSVPIWTIFATTIVIVMVAIELGYVLGHAMHRRSEDEKESPVGAIAGAILGLSAFMLAFTFGIVADRYGSKRALVRDDAVAIRTALQRSDFLPEPDRAEAKNLFREYIDLRIKFAQGLDLQPDVVRSAISETRRIQDRLWEMAVVHGKTDLNSDIGALYVESLNDMIGIHQQRIAIGLQARLPTDLWLVLYFITILGMTSVGYQTGIAVSRRSMAWPILAVSFSLVFGIIASMDRPDSGILKVTQQPLIDVRDFMSVPAKT